MSQSIQRNDLNKTQSRWYVSSYSCDIFVFRFVTCYIHSDQWYLQDWNKSLPDIQENIGKYFDRKPITNLEEIENIELNGANNMHLNNEVHSIYQMFYLTKLKKVLTDTIEINRASFISYRARWIYIASPRSPTLTAGCAIIAQRQQHKTVDFI